MDVPSQIIAASRITDRITEILIIGEIGYRFVVESFEQRHGLWKPRF